MTSRNSCEFPEADLVAAWCGINAIRISPRIETFLTEIQSLGEVMALTRNESAVHEKIGVYDKPIVGKHASLLLGEQIDMRLFPNSWAHGFAVEKHDGDSVRRSLQFFDAAGEAIHKIHLRAASNLDAYNALVARLRLDDQSQTVELTSLPKPEEKILEIEELDAAGLRDRWSQMRDVHEFFGILRSLKMTRHQAVQVIGQDYAWRLDAGALAAMLQHSAQELIPIMCFVGNRGVFEFIRVRSRTSRRWAPGSISSTRLSICTCAQITSPRSGLCESRRKMVMSPRSRPMAQKVK